MSESLTFMMGKFAAILPGDLRYCRNHMWCKPGKENIHQFGFTAYAIRLMQDIYFLDWCVNEGDQLRYKQLIGNIESSKAQSDLFSPLSGQLIKINSEVLKDPSSINVDGYGTGWLFQILGDLDSTMDVQAYSEYLASNWEQTQRILKGQMGD
jgi:glycine cleavage system H protein